MRNQPDPVDRAEQRRNRRRTEGSHREHLAAAQAAAGQHAATVLGLHTGAESMHLAALALLRLIGTKHVFHFSFNRPLQGLMYSLCIIRKTESSVKPFRPSCRGNPEGFLPLAPAFRRAAAGRLPYFSPPRRAVCAPRACPPPAADARECAKKRMNTLFYPPKFYGILQVALAWHVLPPCNP